MRHSILTPENADEEISNRMMDLCNDFASMLPKHVSPAAWDCLLTYAPRIDSDIVLTLNLYSGSKIPGDVNDKFPVNTFRGDVNAILSELRKLFGNSKSGIYKIEIVDDNHQNAKIGQSPVGI